MAFPADVRAVFLGANGAKGVLDVMQPGSIVIDMVRAAAWCALRAVHP